VIIEAENSSLFGVRISKQIKTLKKPLQFNGFEYFIKRATIF